MTRMKYKNRDNIYTRYANMFNPEKLLKVFFSRESVNISVLLSKQNVGLPQYNDTQIDKQRK